MKTNQEKAQLFMKSMETGEQEIVAYIHPDFQHHRPNYPSSKEVVCSFFTSENNLAIETIRYFTDDDIVVTHNRTKSTDGKPTMISFDILSFRDGMITNHWDNMCFEAEDSLSSHTVYGGTTEVADLHKTEINRALISTYKKTVYLEGNIAAVDTYVHKNQFIQHSPLLADGMTALKDYLSNADADYTELRQVLAEGNFVLTICEGLLKGQDTAFFDLYRVEDNFIVEHWEVTEMIPPVEERKNVNGKTDFRH